MLIERGLFVKSLVAALATGGLDIDTTPGPNPEVIRVLLTRDRAGEMPAIGDGDLFTFASRRWRGVPSLIELPNGLSGVVATVDIESYLYGVLAIEASPNWPPETLGAQAIVARTYTRAQRTLSRPYDVVLSQNNQRFGGIEAEFPATNAAVDATRAAVLTYDDGAASVFYAACCGGHSADAAQTWGHVALPYLRGVSDPYCVSAPDYRWQRDVPSEQMRRALGSRVGGAISGFSLGPGDGTGRPRWVEIRCAEGRITLSPQEFRAILGAHVVPSTWLQAVKLEGDRVFIAGAGRGHGIGLCQWGARALGLAQANAATILAFYFPGTRIALVADSRA